MVIRTMFLFDAIPHEEGRNGTRDLRRRNSVINEPIKIIRAITSRIFQFIQQDFELGNGIAHKERVVKLTQKLTVRGIQDKSGNKGTKPRLVRLCFGCRKISVAVELRQRCRHNTGFDAVVQPGEGRHAERENGRGFGADLPKQALGKSLFAHTWVSKKALSHRQFENGCKARSCVSRMFYKRKTTGGDHLDEKAKRHSNK